MGGNLMEKGVAALVCRAPLLHSCIFRNKIRRFLTIFALGIDKMDNIVQNDYKVVI